MPCHNKVVKSTIKTFDGIGNSLFAYWTTRR